MESTTGSSSEPTRYPKYSAKAMSWRKCAAQQLIERHIESFGFDVPQCDLHAAERPRQAAIHEVERRAQLGHGGLFGGGDIERIGALQCGSELGFDQRCVRGGRRFA